MKIQIFHKKFNKINIKNLITFYFAHKEKDIY